MKIDCPSESKNILKYCLNPLADHEVLMIFLCILYDRSKLSYSFEETL